jgi:hypothetical protein
LAIPGFLSFIALVLTWIAAFDCNFYRITYFDSTESRSVTVGIGLWTIESKNTVVSDDYYGYGADYCAGYDQFYSDTPLTSDDLDGAMKAARAFGMMTSIVSLICFVLILIPSCVSYGDNHLFTKVVAAILVFLGIFTMLDLVSEYASSSSYVHYSLSLLSV